MKATIDGIELEGTPSEIAAVISGLRFDDRKGIKSSTDEPRAEVVGDMTDAIAWRILQRKPLSEAQRATLKTLSKNHPKWTSFEELQKATGYSKAQLSGMLGAFGRRVAATHGYAKGSNFLVWDWDYDTGSYNYRLADVALRAVKRADI